MPPIIDTSRTSDLNPKEYIDSIQSSGLPKFDYIMDRYRCSIEYIIENDPKPIKSKPRSQTLPIQMMCLNCKKTYCLDDVTPCDRCGRGAYCSQDCQFDHWVLHKKQCRDLGLIIKMKRNPSF